MRRKYSFENYNLFLRVEKLTKFLFFALLLLLLRSIFAAWNSGMSDFERYKIEIPLFTVRVYFVLFLIIIWLIASLELVQIISFEPLTRWDSFLFELFNWIPLHFHFYSYFLMQMNVLFLQNAVICMCVCLYIRRVLLPCKKIQFNKEFFTNSRKVENTFEFWSKCLQCESKYLFASFFMIFLFYFASLNHCHWFLLVIFLITFQCWVHGKQIKREKQFSTFKFHFLTK